MNEETVPNVTGPVDNAETAGKIAPQRRQELKDAMLETGKKRAAELLTKVSKPENK